MNWLQGLLLGIVQGLAEFLPISSSAHLSICQELFGVGGEENLAFDILVHLATVLSILVVFYKPIAEIVKGIFRRGMNREKGYFLKLLLSAIPILLVALFFRGYVEKVFSTPFVKEHTGNGLLVVGIMLLLTATLLLLSDLRASKKNTADKDGGAQDEPTYRQAFLMGVAQGVAVLPGLSRSGATITTGIFCGVKREVVASFSFLMVIIPLVGEGCLSLIKFMAHPAGSPVATQGSSFLPLALGFLAAFVSGLFACRWMLKLVRRIKFKGFSLYCAIVGMLCIILPYCLK